MRELLPMRPVRDPAAGLRLLIAIPALNEAATIARVISEVPAEIRGVSAVEVLVVDDGSTDDTAARAEAAGAVVVRLGGRQGLGAAFQRALSYAIDHRADLLVSIDADGQFDPADIPKLVQPVVDGTADFATASRFLDPGLTPTMPWARLWGNRMMSRLVSRLAGVPLHDVSCGMRCYSRRALLRLTLVGTFTYTQEVILNLAFNRLRIVEVPIRVQGSRQHGRSRVASNLLRYGFRTARIIFRCYRDYRPLRFFGSLGAACLIAASAFAVFLTLHYLGTGKFSPHKWAGMAAAGFVALGLLMIHLGLLGDMLSRQRRYLEELLMRQRRSDRQRPGGE